MIRHIVLLKFSHQFSEVDILPILKELGELRHTSIPEIKNFSYGKDCSVEDLHQGFQYAIAMQFVSLEHRDIYLKHPEHVKIAEKLKGMLQNEMAVITFDYHEMN